MELSIIKKKCKRIWWTILLYKQIDVWTTYNRTWKKKGPKSYPFKCKWKEPYSMKIKPKTMTKNIFISNILTVEAIIKYEMMRYNMSYKHILVIFLDILPTTYHEELMTKVIFWISLLIFFPIISFKPSSADEAYDAAKIKLKVCRRIVWVCLTISWYWRLKG